jgi:hypothetical protein
MMRTLLVAAVLAWAVPSAAVVYIVPTDEVLVDQSSVIVYGEVGEARPGPFGKLPTTDYMFTVERVLKGDVPGSTLVIRQPGGVMEGDLMYQIMGLPSLSPGDRMLLFLEPDSDAFRTVQLALGMFYETFGLLQREPSLQGAASMPAAGIASSHPRDAEMFMRWIAERAAGREQPSDYFRPTLEPVMLPYKLARSNEGCAEGGGRGGLPLRWQSQDRGEPLVFDVNKNGQAGVLYGGIPQLFQAAAAWNAVDGSFARIKIGSTNNEELFGLDIDQHNTISFGDPTGGLAIAGPWTQTDGGIAAATGVLYYCGMGTSVHTIPGTDKEAYAIVEVDVTTNEGYINLVAALFGRIEPANVFEEIMGHEFGHALGIAHACFNNNPDGLDPCTTRLHDEALMRAGPHLDGRGAALNRDDKDAVQFLYPQNGPTAPTGLAVQSVGQSSLQLTWVDESDDEAGFDVYSRGQRETAFSLLESVGPGATRYVHDGLEAVTYVAYYVVGRDAEGDLSVRSNTASGTTHGPPGCVQDEGTLCLLEGRFRAEIEWWPSGHGESGRGTATRLTPTTGDFWFADEDDIRAAVKITDTCSETGYGGIYAAVLTTDEVVLDVVNSHTGSARTWHSPHNAIFGPVQEPEGILCGDNDASVRVEPMWAEAPSHADGCTGTGTTLCLQSGRFTVEATGAGTHSRTDGTGYLWLNQRESLDVVVRVDDRCSDTSFFAVHVGGLTNDALEMVITDRHTGRQWKAERRAGTPFDTVIDLEGFRCNI